jgi:tetratricopeptide (TPR) repeat protein
MKSGSATNRAAASPIAGVVDKRRVWFLPQTRNSHFTDTAGGLVWLETGLAAARPGSVADHRAVLGGAGTGKTQLALEHAYRSSPTTGIVHWISADHGGEIVDGLRDLAQALGIGCGDGVGTITALHEHLSLSSDRWLVIIDGTVDPGASTGLESPFETAASLLPRLGGGQIGIAGLDRSWREIMEVCELAPWEHAHAVEYLMRRASGADPAEAAELSDALGGLPLALDHAASYCSETGIGYGEYSRRWREARNRGFEGLRATLDLAWREVKKDHRSVNVLRLASFLAASGIPRDVFVAPLNVHDPIVYSDPDIATKLDAALALLRRFSLVSFGPGTVLVHQLVQNEVRGAMTGEERELALCHVLLTLVARIRTPPPSQSRHRAAQLLESHVMAAASFVEAGSQATRPAISALGEVVHHFQTVRNRAGLLRASELSWRLALAADLHAGDVAAIQSTFATALLATGNPARADEVIRPAVEWVRADGSSDPRAAGIVLNHHAHLLDARGETSASLDVLEQAAEIEVQEFGPESDELASTLSNVGHALLIAGQPREAIDALTRGYRGRRAARGDQDPDTTRDGLSLAQAHAATGDFSAAFALLAPIAATIRTCAAQGDDWAFAASVMFAQAAADAATPSVALDLLEHCLKLRPGDTKLKVESQLLQAIALDDATAVTHLLSALKLLWNDSQAEAGDLFRVTDWAVVVLTRLGRTDEAIGLLNRLWARVEADDRSNPNLVQLAYVLASIVPESDARAAKRWLHRGAALLSQGVASDPAVATELLLRLGHAEWEDGNRSKALSHLVAAKARAVQLHARNQHHDLQAKVDEALAAVAAAVGEPQLAIELVERPHTIGLTAEPSLEMMALRHAHAGIAYSREKRWPQAVEALRRAAELKERVWGDSAPALASTYHNLALALIEVTRLRPAIAAVDRAVELESRQLAESDPSRMTSLALQLRLHHAGGSFLTAHRALRQLDALVDSASRDPHVAPDHLDAMRRALSDCRSTFRVNLPRR